MRVHDLRHTFARRLRAAGVSAEDRAALLGHATQSMSKNGPDEDVCIQDDRTLAHRPSARSSDLLRRLAAAALRAALNSAATSSASTDRATRSRSSSAAAFLRA